VTVPATIKVDQSAAATDEAPAAWSQVAFVERLEQWCRATLPAETIGRRRGCVWQQPQRLVEQDLRGRVVVFAEWTAQRGLTLPQTAQVLQLAPRTLRHWRQMLALAQGAQPLGRPVLRSAVGQRQEVLELLQELGAGVGLPTLRECFPALPRAELEDLLRRYRRVCRTRYHETLHVLHWQRPGSVWAMDFAEPPVPIDGIYRYLLAVRDLASGQQLLWLPLEKATAALLGPVLTGLFAVYGAPLVLKSDNGYPFGAGAIQALLASAGVIPLFSPPYWPRYNGAIEAGIGSLKTRTERQAARHDHPGEWTHDDVAAAREEANSTARPRGPAGPTPQEMWRTRRRLTTPERALFQEAVDRLREEKPFEATSLHQEEETRDGASLTREARRHEREVIQRALVEHAYLLFRRRRIPPPIRRRKAATIP
jgi:transposase InsO family protein